MASLFHPHHLLCYWTSVWFLCALDVSAMEQFCVRNATINCTFICVNDTPPALPPFPDVGLWPGNLSHLVLDCLPKEATTTEHLTTVVMSTVDQSSPPTTGVITSTGSIIHGTTLTITHSTSQGNTQITTQPTAADVSTNVTNEPRPTTPEPPFTTGTTTRKPGSKGGGKVPWYMVLFIVLACIGCLALASVGIYCCVKMKKRTCKIHNGSDSGTCTCTCTDQKPPPHGKNPVQIYHEDGTLVLTPVVDHSLNHPSSCNASYLPNPDSADQLPPSDSPPNGRQVISTAHLPDPAEENEDRNRTFSTGSWTADTAILMPVSTEGTSQPETTKRKKRKKRGSKHIELAEIQPKGALPVEIKSEENV